MVFRLCHTVHTLLTDIAVVVAFGAGAPKINSSWCM